MDCDFKIGEVAEMFDISVRSLHLYDKMGLLRPDYIDDLTGYRYYNADQIYKLQTILSLKKIGFTLNEIKILFDNNFNQNDFLIMLNNKADYFQKQIDIAEFNIENIKRMINAVEASSGVKNSKELSEEENAVKLSKIVSLENLKLENLFSEILWL
jgi:DNA-binding transcriptional MerR regulator